jgi:hypothetical protein
MRKIRFGENRRSQVLNFIDANFVNFAVFQFFLMTGENTEKEFKGKCRARDSVSPGKSPFPSFGCGSAILGFFAMESLTIPKFSRHSHEKSSPSVHPYTPIRPIL